MIIHFDLLMKPDVVDYPQASHATGQMSENAWLVSASGTVMEKRLRNWDMSAIGDSQLLPND